MDLPGSGPYFSPGACGENVIQRADAWRLLYLPTREEDGLHYENFPFSPWHPCRKNN
ncbi:hypothetical protein BDV30DRAFT_215033 [Aspergillus minisclerotigenes]|uniref:Uncharacterized protein n=1 Tax=Aspergillus minisclerotigenes TaxID=656917 RepID=A0A5N6IV04_9EURO|nr:hypothetical protein BDV30DRAFT_215033 [Aspergillus minisclerotigenes]